MSGVADNLRAIVNDYYHGLLTFDSYREQRSKLFDAMQLAARRPPVPVPEPASPPPVPPPAAEQTQTNTAARARPAAPAAPAVVSARPRARLPFGVVAGVSAGVVAVVAIALYAYLPRSANDLSPPAPTSTQPAAALPPGAALLEQFMQRNVWAPDSVRNLEVTWSSALTDEQRQATRASATYSRFAETLRRRIREEEALTGAQRSADLESLVLLAQRLEMPYAASLSLPTQSAPAAATGTAPAAARDDADALAPADEESAASLEPKPEQQSPASAPDEEVAPPVTRAAEPTPTPAAPPPQSAATAATVAPTPAPSPAAPAQAAQTDAGADCSAELLNTRRPFCRDLLRDGREGPALAILPAGRFLMGGDQANEGPPHEVTIPASIAMSVYEISFGDFGAYCTGGGAPCPNNPWGSPDSPVVQVSWSEAVAYAEWLSTETGHRYRLPSEAEWEYAARAGTTTPYPFGDAVTPTAARSSANGAVASPLANSDRSVNRNAFRLFHMIGNVREWVADEWHADYAGAPADGSARAGAPSAPHVVRGGAYADGARPLRSAARLSLPSDTRDRLTGFRVVRELPE